MYVGINSETYENLDRKLLLSYWTTEVMDGTRRSKEHAVRKC